VNRFTTEAIDELRAARAREDAAIEWRYRRAASRVSVIDGIVAEFATGICGRPVRRREVLPLQSSVEVPGIKWSIDGHLAVQFIHEPSDPDRLVVYEIALLRSVKKAIRSRHVRITYLSGS